ncbi:putative Twin-arginine translocation signal domain-containing protein [uncultured Gammaproteobacteria bacterium]
MSADGGIGVSGSGVSVAHARRWFLEHVSCLALGGVLVVAARPVAAFQTMPEGDYSALVEKACGATADHARQLEQTRDRLDTTLTREQVQTALQALRCPVCGCPLVGDGD